MSFAEFFSDSIADTCYTPDLPALETQDYWDVFIYDRRKGKLSGYLTNEDSDAEFISIGWTKSAIYSILNIQSEEAAYQLADSQGTDRILGEVWSIPTEMLLDLDSDLYCQIMTRRIRVPVVIGSKGVVDAWMYTTERNYLLRGGLTISKHTASTYYGAAKFLEIF